MDVEKVKKNLKDTNWLVLYFPRAIECVAWATIDLTGSGEAP
jgi:hypothetical protein